MYERTILKILSFQEPVLKAFTLWLTDSETPDITIEGYSYRTLVKKMKMRPVGAFITLDWLLREPEKAKKALIQGIK